MLTEAKELQQNAVAQLIQLSKTKNNIVFRAPTGSGKTYMMADFMNHILMENSDIVFIVSTRSKGNLDKQNYEKFCEYINNGIFTNLNPYLINTDIASEERLFIPLGYNVYILPSDLTKKGGRLMQGALHNFLNTMTGTLYKQNKILYLIKDECHIATNNLDISLNFFTKTFYFSATPKLSQGQHPDIIISDEEAENAKLIKTIIWGDEEATERDAITKFEEIKNDYINKLGVNPCLIIQISNKDKEEEEWANILKSVSSDSKQLRPVEKNFFIEENVCLWGKNYLPNSVIKFEYYMRGVKNSFPDFVMKDKYDRIHIFEVKSLNKSVNQILDENLYKVKAEELRKCYLEASKITKQIFYLPVIKDDVWQIKMFINGETKELTKEMFIEFVKNKP